MRTLCTTKNDKIMNRNFWFTIKDNDKKTYDVTGPISDDTAYLNTVVEAQRNGFEITCDTPQADG